MRALEGPLSMRYRASRYMSAILRSNRPKAGSANVKSTPLVSLATTYSPVP